MSKAFAENLKNYRLLNHMTQTDLAYASATTRSNINNYESGRSEPSFELLCRFADVLGVEITDLVEEHKSYPDMVRRVSLTDEEAAVIQAYRAADPIYQNVAMEILYTHRRSR